MGRCAAADTPPTSDPPKQHPDDNDDQDGATNFVADSYRKRRAVEGRRRLYGQRRRRICLDSVDEGRLTVVLAPSPLWGELL